MNKPAKIVIVKPTVADNSPVSMRMDSLDLFFSENGLRTTVQEAPQTIGEKFKLVKKLILSDNIIFVTMPPFSLWPLALMFTNKLIIDWRDGWSIAMKTGYGETVKANKAKAFFAQIIEILYLRFAYAVITCTTGLYDYHLKKGPRQLLFVPNGHIISIDKELFKKLNLSKSKLLASCAGKFSEYGKRKAKKLIQTLRKRYPDIDNIELNLIGSDYAANEWAVDYGEKYRITVKILPKRTYKETIELLKQSDLAAIIIRDPDYDFGTKIFDAISTGIPVIDIFEGTSFRDYFAGCFDTDYDYKNAYHIACEHNRHQVAKRTLSDFIQGLKEDNT